MNTMTLIDAALASRKPKKEAAMQFIRDLAAAHPDDFGALAMLYAYFMPPLPAKADTDFEWVARSVGVNDARTGLNYVLVEDEVMVAANGHTLHLAPADREPGYYHPATGEKVTADYKYPDWRRVVPPTDESGFVPFTLDMKETTVKERRLQSGTMHILQVPTDSGVQSFNRKYVLSALNRLTTMKGYISTDADYPKMVLEDGARKAVIMGIRN